MNEETTSDGSAVGPSSVGVCALLTCFNRRDTTLACLRALAASTGLAHGALHAVLVDDGSSDGTAQAVRAEFPWVEVVVSDGSLFWCRGMHLAFETAMRQGFDHYLWLNDDTTLRSDALAGLLACEALLRQRTEAPIIVVGSTVDAATGAHNYGGERQPSRIVRFRVERVSPSSAPQRCDTITGNIVLIPARVAQRVGNLDPALLFAPWSALERAVRSIVTEGAQSPGHIFNLGHGVLPETDPEVLTRVVELVHEASAR